MSKEHEVWRWQFTNEFGKRVESSWRMCAEQAAGYKAGGSIVQYVIGRWVFMALAALPAPWLRAVAVGGNGFEFVIGWVATGFLLAVGAILAMLLFHLIRSLLGFGREKGDSGEPWHTEDFYVGVASISITVLVLGLGDNLYFPIRRG